MILQEVPGNPKPSYAGMFGSNPNLSAIASLMQAGARAGNPMTNMANMGMTSNLLQKCKKLTIVFFFCLFMLYCSPFIIKKQKEKKW